MIKQNFLKTLLRGVLFISTLTFAFTLIVLIMNIPISNDNEEATGNYNIVVDDLNVNDAKIKDMPLYLKYIQNRCIDILYPALDSLTCEKNYYPNYIPYDLTICCGNAKFNSEGDNRLIFASFIVSLSMMISSMTLLPLLTSKS